MPEGDPLERTGDNTTGLALHPSHAGPMRKSAVLLALLAIGLVPALLLAGHHGDQDVPGFLALHGWVEVSSIVVSAMIFSVSWNSRRLVLSGNAVLVGSLFMGVALTDLSHTLSYAGMPDYVTRNSPEKAINFWLTARLLAALALLVNCLPSVTHEPRRPSAAYWQLGAVLALVAVLHWVFFFHADWIPRTFESDLGLTPFKIACEYLLMGLNGIAALALLLRMRRPWTSSAPGLFCAALTAAMSELTLTLYANVDDAYNLVGHLYKLASYLFLYRAIFLETIQRPYRQLDAAQSQLADTLRTIPDPLWLKDMQGRYLACNPAFERLCGLDQNKIIGRTESEILEPSLAARHAEQDRQVLSGGHNVGNQEWLTRAGDGYRGLFETIRTPMRGQGDANLGVLGIARDITATHEAQLALSRSELRLRHAIRAASIGIFEHDHERDEVYCSPELRLHFGVPADLPITIPFFMTRVHPADRARVMATITRSHDPQGDGVCDMDHSILRDDGEVRLIRTRARTTFKGEGSLRTLDRTIGAMADITDRWRAEAALKQLNLELERRVLLRTVELERARDEAQRANTAKSDFLSAMSHELRTPMNAILGFSQLLETDRIDRLPERQLKFVQGILEAGGHLLNLINEVLDLARIESGKLEVRIEVVEVSPLIEECLALMKPIADEHRVELPAGGSLDGDWQVHADRTRLKQILLNLLSNAIKYNRAGGRVGIACEADGGGWTIHISDTGNGLSEGQQQRLFRNFERLEQHESAIEGAGVGLALSKRLVEAMHGAIGISSEVGVGSTFWIHLPAAKTAAAEQGRQNQ